jgi:Inositol phospholipid synthesis and fat-storage-inducing TM
VLGLWWFSLLNTAAYFHTTLEKVTGLIAGLMGWYIVQVLTTSALAVAGIQNM